MNELDELRDISVRMARLGSAATNIDFGIKVVVVLLGLILWRVW